MPVTIIMERWKGLRVRYARPRPTQDMELPTRRVFEPRDDQPHPDSVRTNVASARLEDLAVAPTRYEDVLKFMGSIRKSSLFAPQRWIKSLRALRIIAWPFSFLWPMHWPGMWFNGLEHDMDDLRERWLSFNNWEILFGSLFMAWDLWRMLHSLYEHPPGYHFEIILITEIFIMIACTTAMAKDISFLTIIFSQGYVALYELPAVLLSMYIVGRHVWRYPARRRERIQYATIKPQLAFTPSGEPVAIYLLQEIYGPSDISMLSMDSLQEDPDSQANDPECLGYETHDSSRHDNESQVSLLSERATTSFAIHDNIKTAVHRPIQTPQWSEEYSR